MIYTETHQIAGTEKDPPWFFGLPWSETHGRSDAQLSHTGERKAREADKLNQTKVTDHLAGKVLGRTAVLRSNTLSARASCHSQLGVVMYERAEHVGGSVAAISGLVADKLVGFNHRALGRIVSFSLMTVVPLQPAGMMSVPCYPSRTFSLAEQRNTALCLSPPGPGFFSWSPLLPRKSSVRQSSTAPKAEDPILKTYTGKALKLLF